MCQVSWQFWGAIKKLPFCLANIVSKYAVISYLIHDD
jgi:hypothetical protein